MKAVARLYRQFQPENYQLELKPDRNTMTFSGKAVILGKKAGPPSQRLTLHQKGLKINSAKVFKIDKSTGRQPIEISRLNSQKSYDELRLHTDQKIFPGEYVVELEFSGRITDAMHGIYPCYFNNRQKSLIATQLESHHAREVFPCIDEPEAKATFDLTLTVPAGETVIANTPVKTKKTTAKNQIVTFQTSPRMSTYLLAFVFGEMAYSEAKTKKGLIVRSYATPQHAKLMDFATQTAVGCVEFYEDYFGVDYPLPKLDLAALPDFSAGAMENWGLMTFRESMMLSDSKHTSIESKQYIALVVAHEIAHMWFGDLVTMKWWDDLWLNESFATLMEYCAVDDLFPEWKIWEQFVTREVGGALMRDSLPNVQPVSAVVHHPDQLTSLFDPAIVYAKGASLLNMVRNMIGDDDFRSGLRSYFKTHAYKNTEADDLWRALGQAAKQDIGTFMENWLKKPGYPSVSIEHQPGEKTLKASQKRLLVGGQETAKETIWQVPLALPTEENLTLTKEADEFIIEAAAEPLIVDHDGKSYFVANYTNPDHKQAIIEAIKAGELDVIDRLQLIQHQELLEKALMVSTVDNLKLLEAFGGETAEAVWSEIAGIIANARRLVAGNEKYEQKLNRYIAKFAAPLANKLGWQSKTSDSSQTLRLRDLALTIAAAAQVKKVVDEGLAHFRSFKQPSDLAPDIRSSVYYIGARYGTAKDFAKLVKAYLETETADEKDEISAGLTYTRVNEQISELLKMITKPEQVRPQDAPFWFGRLLGNHYSSAMAWDWLVSNWQWVLDNYGSDKNYERFPRYAGMIFSKKTELAKFKKFFEPKAREVALKLIVNLGIEDIEGRIAWREKNQPELKKWLDSFS